MFRASRAHLSRWADSRVRSRFDYDTPNHTLAEIMSDVYFSTMYDEFRQGDEIYVTDAAQARAKLVVADVDDVAHLVRIDLDTTYTQTPVTASGTAPDTGYAIRWKGPRGGKFVIVSSDGDVVHRDIQTKHEAERQLANMLEKAAA